MKVKWQAVAGAATNILSSRRNTSLCTATSSFRVCGEEGLAEGMAQSRGYGAKDLDGVSS